MGLLKKIGSALSSAFEADSMSPSNRAYWGGLLLFLGEQGSSANKYGAARALELTSKGYDWSIMLGGELRGRDIRDSNTSKGIENFPEDSVWIVAPNAPDGNYFAKIADDYSKWKKALNKIAGKSYDPKNERQQDGLAMAITIAGSVAAVVVSAFATPAAGAAVAAGTAALAGAVKAGGSPAELATAAANGTADAAAALQESDPETAALLEDYAEALTTVTTAATSSSSSADTTTTTPSEDESSSLEQLLERARTWAEDHPALTAGAAGGVGLGGLLLLRAILRG